MAFPSWWTLFFWSKSFLGFGRATDVIILSHLLSRDHSSGVFLLFLRIIHVKLKVQLTLPLRCPCS